MILLNGTSNALEAVMGTAATTTEPTYFISYVSVNGNVLNQAYNASGNLNGTSQVAMLTGVSTAQYKVDQLDIYNADTVNQTIKVNVLVSATNINLYVATLVPGGSLHYDTGSNGFYVTNAAGAITQITSSTSPNVQVFSSSGNQVWTKPTYFTPSVVDVICIGGGGGGGGGGSVTTGAIVMGGGGGGGGAYARKTFNAADLGATVNLTVDTGGAGGGVGVSGAVGVVGTSATGSMFGGNTQATAYLFAGGGGGGALGAVTGAVGTGGSGGGTGGNGGQGTTSAVTGGVPGSVVAASGPTGGQGASTSVTVVSLPAEYGGGAGAGHTAVPANWLGGASIFGGGGGGNGAGATAAAIVAATAGGVAGYYLAAGGGGGAAGVSSTTQGSVTAGSQGTTGNSTIAGAGGGGGGGGSGGTVHGQVGGAGGQPGGGGGGGGCAWTSTGVAGIGGAGGLGLVIVACW